MLDAQVSQSAPSDVKIKQRPRIYTSPQISYAEHIPTPCSVSNKHNESGNDANILPSFSCVYLNALETNNFTLLLQSASSGSN
ncbi:hypothetical protein PNOK_0001700 [Pyrrhoderma noxium]|uniref:Uncharacterized protein n=1 Tax=Pyrrhoderma noxium TaxID=2282107 RepID=A0A286UTL6_9AGAM|nr:hypothetical protein PNOK_0001700 [Pyrrhoderma noxium]